VTVMILVVVACCGEGDHNGDDAACSVRFGSLSKSF
jgi:hypothetical protein